MQRINLIPARCLQNRFRKLRLRRWSLVCSIYGAVLLTITLVLQAAWSFDDQAVADQINRTTQGMQTARQTMSDLRLQLAEAVKQLEAGRAVSVQPDWSVLLAMLSDIRRDTIALGGISVQPVEIKAVVPAKSPVASQAKPATVAVAGRPNYRLAVSGLSSGQNEVSEFALRLEQTGLFERVKLLESVRQQVGSTQFVAFKIECEITEEPPRSRR